MGQLGEEDVRREASPQPGEAPQQREARQAGDGGPGPVPLTSQPARDQNQDHHHQDDEEEDGWRGVGADGGEEGGQHGSSEVEENEEATKKP